MLIFQFGQFEGMLMITVGIIGNFYLGYAPF